MVVGYQIMLTLQKILANLHLAFWYGLTMHLYVSKKFWRMLVCWCEGRQSNCHQMFLAIIWWDEGCFNACIKGS